MWLVALAARASAAPVQLYGTRPFYAPNDPTNLFELLAWLNGPTHPHGTHDDGSWINSPPNGVGTCETAVAAKVANEGEEITSCPSDDGSDRYRLLWRAPGCRGVSKTHADKAWELVSLLKPAPLRGR